MCLLNSSPKQPKLSALKQKCLTCDVGGLLIGKRANSSSGLPGNKVAFILLDKSQLVLVADEPAESSSRKLPGENFFHKPALFRRSALDRYGERERSLPAVVVWLGSEEVPYTTAATFDSSDGRTAYQSNYYFSALEFNLYPRCAEISWAVDFTTVASFATLSLGIWPVVPATLTAEITLLSES